MTGTTTVQEFRVPERFCGPPEIANGGWISGLAAGFLPGAGAVEVTLRAPTPLETAVRVERTAAGVTFRLGEQVLAEAVPVPQEPEPAPFVPLERAAEAGAAFPGLDGHPFPRCFVCGFREEGDGLRIHPGPTSTPGVFAAPWHVPAVPAGHAAAPLPLSQVWGALDCVSAWVHLRPGDVALLGRLTGRVRRPVFPGRTYVVTARHRGVERRKLFAASAVYEPDGTLVAAARATWIAVGQ
ncbi:hotdog fold domain-containing protein [Thermoactinospora rubra]|uniref:hotdog fold domain-containing protein n=1 Tax=Thermoactinospora rubra TaxID=1088767 RepID=UPI000A11266A|nr:hotdog fold domain-containing protein [Thermoactinospora rubra]